MSTTVTVSRRDFIKVISATGAGLVLGFYVPSKNSEVWAQDDTKAFTPNVWLRIDTNGIVTIIVARSELGQGVRTSLPMIVAEELEADWSTIRVEQARAHPKKYGSQTVGGSWSVRGSFERLRKAGCAAREMLITAAAQRWAVDRSTCVAESGTVIHTPTGRKLGYGELAEAASQIPVPEDPPLKDPKDFKIIGKWTRRLDTPEKSTGRAIFGIDVKVPGMVYATVARCPVFGGKVARFDATKAKTIDGVRDVMQIDQGIAVIADSTWAAIQGREGLEITWDEGPDAKLSSGQIRRMFEEMARKDGAVAEEEGNVEEAMGSAARMVEAVYEVPFLAHAAMEPMNCVADVRQDRCIVWAGTQTPQQAQNEVAAQLGLATENVVINIPLIGGGFGRRLDNDFVIEAVQISRSVGAPVKLVWTREDDMQHDFYRPASYHKLRGALDENGRLVGWTHRIVAPSISGQRWPQSIENGLDRGAVDCAVNMPYEIRNLRVDYVMANTPVPTGWWRSVYAAQNTYVVESFIDELAAAVKSDPYSFRMEMLHKTPRMKKVVEVAAAKVGWGKPRPKGRSPLRGHFHGVACAKSFGTYVAQVAEVSVSREGAVRVHRVVAAVDCGMAVNPNPLEAQIESGIVFGITAALGGEITVRNGRVEQANFDDYPLLTIGEMPKVEVHIVESMEALGGIGEVGVPPAAPAVCNAVYAATGKPVRRLPVRLSG